jgi:multidrug efflux pump subunit AcrA (membrane-fusion protein)
MMQSPHPRFMRAAVLLVLAASGAPFLGACGREGRADPSGAAQAASESAPLEVRTALVVRARWERSVPAVGELRPDERVVVATKVPGRLAELAVDRGQRVRRGELVASLEAREYELRVLAAEAAVSVTRAQLGLQRCAPRGGACRCRRRRRSTSPSRPGAP